MYICTHAQKYTQLKVSQQRKYDTLLSTSKNSAINSSISSSVKGSCTIKIRPNLSTMKWKMKRKMYNSSKH